MTARRGVKKWTWQIKLVDVGPKGGMLLTLLAMLRWMNTDGNCYMSQETLAKKTGQSRRTVIRHIKAARIRGWLHIERHPIEGKKGYFRNEYFATLPTAVELSDIDQELCDALHSCEGDVGEEYENHENYVTSQQNHVTPQHKLGDISDTNYVTPGIHKYPLKYP